MEKRLEQPPYFEKKRRIIARAEAVAAEAAAVAAERELADFGREEWED